MKNYLPTFSLFAAIVAALLWLMGSLFVPGQVNSISWGIYFYFVITTIAFHYGLLRSAEGKPQAFIRYYIGSTTMKLMLHLGILVLYVLFNKADAMRFIFTFMIFYFVFTGFEVSLVWKKFRSGK
ncbi:MAG TPA: hypothetical protein PKK99_01415 [Bacteroidia bacterium]|nr:hypothetical protein [Bacteroidia bacterium]HNP97679.1 hypothetical protein [Bacteroidia bacterium]